MLCKCGTYLHPGVKGMQIRHLPPLLRFIPQFVQIFIVFALSKFEACVAATDAKPRGL